MRKRKRNGRPRRPRKEGPARTSLLIAAAGTGVGINLKMGPHSARSPYLLMLMLMSAVCFAFFHGDVGLLSRRQSPLTSYAKQSYSILDAYSKCCADDEINCTQSDEDWFSRLTKKSKLVSAGKATLYWAHMRKAGGTTFGSIIESKVFNHTQNPSSMFTRGFTRTVKMHLWAGSAHCVDHIYANETLFVTILRHPVERYVSEYYYLNVGKTLKTNTTKEMVFEWYNRSRRSDGVDMSKARLNFIDNWQTRWYTNPNVCDDLDRPPPHDSHKNYSYWRSGHKHDPRTYVGADDLSLAKSVIDKFDVVGVAPFFGEECDMLPWLLVAGSNKPLHITNAVHNKNTQKNMSARDDFSTQVMLDLQEQIKLDLELFEFAKDLSMRRSRIACCVNDLFQV